VAVWTDEERNELESIVDAVISDVEPLSGKRVLVMCSATGEVAFRFADRIGDNGEVIGIEYNDRLLQRAVAALGAGPSRPVRFEKAVMDHLSFPSASFDAVVSEFIVYPTSDATEIGQPEMARVLRPGGVMTITDVIVPSEPPPDVRADLEAAGLDYLCVATMDDFEGWMEEAGMIDVELADLTPLVQPIWRRRLSAAPETGALVHLFGSGPWSLGVGLHYIKVRGTKPV
jgi:SAM-dependent methyltransferase